MPAPSNLPAPFPQEVLAWMAAAGVVADPVEIRAWLASAGLSVKASYRLDEVARLFDLSVRAVQGMAQRGDLAVIGSDRLEEPGVRHWARRVALTTLIRHYPAF